MARVLSAGLTARAKAVTLTQTVRPTLRCECWQLLPNIKRLGRYLQGQLRSSSIYAWQGGDEEVQGYSGSDWAGCRVTGKSTNGGVVMIGTHFIKGWARTQNHVTLGAAEAELIALIT